MKPIMIIRITKKLVANGIFSDYMISINGRSDTGRGFGYPYHPEDFNQKEVERVIKSMEDEGFKVKIIEDFRIRQASIGEFL